jgi:ParB family chromosome partitioning protein
MTKLPGPPSSQEIEQFDPERYRLKIAALDYGIEEAKRIRDWPALEKAVDLKIDEQRRFVAWWDANVRDGGRPSQKPPENAGGFPRTQAEKLTGIPNQRKSDMSKWLDEPDEYRDHLLGTQYRAAMLEAAEYLRGTQGTGEQEWFTPPEYIELARAVLGEIDLDPASSEKAQEVVRAERYFTAANDGLLQEWRGRTWLNPPFSKTLIPEFVSKMCAEYAAGRVTAAIMLTHNHTDTAWFHEAAKACDAICFTRGRVKFYRANGKIAAPTQGQAFFYFGAHAHTFAEKFGSIGFVR